HRVDSPQSRVDSRQSTADSQSRPRHFEGLPVVLTFRDKMSGPRAMRRIHRLGSLLPLLLLCVPLSASERKEAKSDREGESELIRERVRLYLQRHGDSGRIDPERRLRTVAGEYSA